MLLVDQVINKHPGPTTPRGGPFEGVDKRKIKAPSGRRNIDINDPRETVSNIANKTCFAGAVITHN